jgi:hypothetical protein
MERRFSGRHGLFIDLARIVSAFFSPLFYSLSTQNFLFLFLIFIILQLPLPMGGCLFTMYVSKERGGISTGTVGMYRKEWYQKGTLFYLMTMVYGCIAIRQKRTTTHPKALLQEANGFLHKGYGKVARTGKRSWWWVLGFHIEGGGKIMYELARTCRGVDLGDTFDTLME